jgi:hypothetical protein
MTYPCATSSQGRVVLTTSLICGLRGRIALLEQSQPSDEVIVATKLRLRKLCGIVFCQQFMVISHATDTYLIYPLRVSTARHLSSLTLFELN